MKNNKHAKFLVWAILDNRASNINQIMSVIQQLNMPFKIIEIKYFSSIDEPKEEFKKKDYYPFKIIKDFPFHRGIYENVNYTDIINFMTDTGGVRTVLLELKQE